jgi:signal transduction histidine kinase
MSAASATPANAPATVLLVEDNPGDARIIAELLSEVRGNPWCCETAQNLASAHDRLHRGGVQVALLDLDLPDARGIEAVTRTSLVFPDLPVVVLTGLDDSAAALAAIHSRAQDYLVKGRIDASALDRSLRYAIERKRLELQLRHSQRMEAIGRLAGGVAHDFNNLLGVIIGRCEILERRGDVADDALRHLLDIQKAAFSAAALTRQLLTFSRKLPLAFEVLELSAVMPVITRLLERILGEDIELRTDIADACRVKADRAQFEQVIMNLAANARDAMPRGGVFSIAAEVRALAAPKPGLPAGKYVEIRFEDTGSGIDAATLPHVFEPYFTTKSVGRGTGLGLSSVHGTVEQAGGTIAVSSEPGRGTTFTILLPLAAEAPADAGAAAPIEGAKGTETILLVEDNEALRHVAAEVLADRGYRVHAVAGAAEALAAAGERPFHLLLTDVVLPGLDGCSLWRQLRALVPALRVLFVSGYNEELVLQHGLGGADAKCLRKPFTVDDLARAVREVLDAPVALE